MAKRRSLAEDPAASAIQTYLQEQRRRRARAQAGIELIWLEGEKEKNDAYMTEIAAEALADAMQHKDQVPPMLQAIAEHLEHDEPLPDAWRVWLAGALNSVANDQATPDKALALGSRKGRPRMPTAERNQDIFAMVAVHLAFGLTKHAAALALEKLGHERPPIVRPRCYWTWIELWDKNPAAIETAMFAMKAPRLSERPAVDDYLPGPRELVWGKIRRVIP